MSSVAGDAGSFRDPSGQVFVSEDRVLRTVNAIARESYETIRARPIFQKLIANNRLIRSDELSQAEWPEALRRAAYVVAHPKLPFISYPYEWGFQALKAAALHHLDLQRDLLAEDIVLSDASAYNVQFDGPRPIFIDTLSLRPYREGEYWLGHRQFCEQFLNPLLLRALLGVPHNAWFRGSLEGIQTSDLARLLPTRKKLSWNVLPQVLLQAKLERQALDAPDAAVAKVRRGRGLSRSAYNGMLTQLRNWIARLTPADTGKTVWGDYAKTHTYSGEEAAQKRRAVSEFASRIKPRMLIDLGCNTGDYSVAALDGGAERVIGFDFDQRAVDLAYQRAVECKLDFFPLWLDAANPSPDQGWNQSERRGFAKRAKADAMVALAFEHHLAIGKNIPLPGAVEWMMNTAPVGIIEFVPKNDSTIQRMLALREDIFADYSESAFVQALERHGRIIDRQVVSSEGRTLFMYDRRS